MFAISEDLVAGVGLNSIALGIIALLISDVRVATLVLSPNT